MTKMTAEEFGKMQIPGFSNATHESVTETLRTIDRCAHSTDAKELSYIAMETRSLVDNFRLHPSAACDLVRLLAQGTFAAMVKAEEAVNC